MKGSSSVHRFTLHSVGRVMMISPSYSELPWLRFLLILAFFATLTIAHPKAAKSAPAGYAPQQEGCPKGQMVRPADGLSPKEKSYIQQRKLRAQKSLAKWLKSVDNKFPECEMPTLAMASSGGGYRAMLLGAGFVQSFDARDSNSSLNGLYQSLSYHAALSGGAWLVSSIQGNGHERVSKLKVDLWDKFLPKNSLWPVNTAAAPEYPAIKADIQSKAKSGFAPTIADPWGRFLSYQLLKGDDGGVATTLSSISNSPSWKRFQNPFLIMTATSVNDITTAQCDPTHDTLQYEFSPYEFGSWDKGVAAFTSTEFLGSKVENGAATGSCYKGYDNLGYMIGTSSSKFQEDCGKSTLSLVAGPTLNPLVTATRNATESIKRENYAPFKNPFFKYPASSAVKDQEELYLVDGGQADQNNPVWPLLQPARGVDVILVNDNSADTDSNFPNGTEILETYRQAQRTGLIKMPFIPPVDEFVSKGLHQRATFFGCGDASKTTLIFLPNFNFTSFNSGVPSSQFEYSSEQMTSMIEAGGRVATQNGDKEWPKCLACGIVEKKIKLVALPVGCRGLAKKEHLLLILGFQIPRVFK
ncbi:hypothetical protein EG328_001945 [Venturia inaequalis]|uniref:Lysophospholipase n=1 Tax=Venturia inaequalis TaxID=5025 RepID=A0A8H3ZCE4_VENIN|nr:hypothetical protein EG328_001945 [Venturia inaequalis]KAE9994420.1 hypothetical protein EG327_010046 [Venturia inaequalis]